MKKLIQFLIVVVICSLLSFCSNDSSSSSSNNGVGQGGSMAVFSIKDNYLYTVDNLNLHVFQISETTNPVKVNNVYIGRDIETIYSFNNFLFMGSRNGMYIYDISNPETPKFISQAMHFTACDPVVANDKYAYVTLHSNRNCGTTEQNVLLIYDIAIIKTPILIHQRNLTYPRGLAIYEDYLIICDDELKIFDASNPTEPKLVKSFNSKYKDIVLYNDIMYVFGEHKITQYKWNTNDFLSLTPISEISY